MFHATSKILVTQPSVGTSPAGFPRLHVELRPRDVSRLVGYDPRVLVAKPPRRSAKGTRDFTPHNVSPAIIRLQNTIQRSIDPTRVRAMVDYLVAALEGGAFADWGSIELATTSLPDLAKRDSVLLESDADYFPTDGQHRYCALLDLIHDHPELADRFTQGVTISILPAEKMEEWAGQEFHDRNYFAVPVRPGKALATDMRDPVNAITRAMAKHQVIVENGGIAGDRDVLPRGDARFVSHSVLHRFIRAFLMGRPGLDARADARAEVSQAASEWIGEYLSALGMVMGPGWKPGPERDEYLSRASAVWAALGVLGHDLYFAEPPIPTQVKSDRLAAISRINWDRHNLGLVGILGSAKGDVVTPASSRQAIDSVVRYLRERVGIDRAPS